MFISWGTVVAIVTFAVHEQNLVGKTLFVVSVLSLGAILLFHLLILFLNFIGSGAHWDDINIDNTDKGVDDFSRQIGSAIRFLLLSSFFVLFPVALISSLWLILLNI